MVNSCMMGINNHFKNRSLNLWAHLFIIHPYVCMTSIWNQTKSDALCHSSNVRATQREDIVRSVYNFFCMCKNFHTESPLKVFRNLPSLQRYPSGAHEWWLKFHTLCAPFLSDCVLSCQSNHLKVPKTSDLLCALPFPHSKNSHINTNIICSSSV